MSSGSCVGFGDVGFTVIRPRSLRSGGAAAQASPACGVNSPTTVQYARCLADRSVAAEYYYRRRTSCVGADGRVAYVVEKMSAARPPFPCPTCSPRWPKAGGRSVSNRAASVDLSRRHRLSGHDGGGRFHGPRSNRTGRRSNDSSCGVVHYDSTLDVYDPFCSARGRGDGQRRARGTDTAKSPPTSPSRAVLLRLTPGMLT